MCLMWCLPAICWIASCGVSVLCNHNVTIFCGPMAIIKLYYYYYDYDIYWLGTHWEENHQCVCDVFEIWVNNIKYYYYHTGSKITCIILYFKHIHIVVIITHYKCMGYVIIPKPHFSSREGVNSRCRHFYFLLYRRFDSIYPGYDRGFRSPFGRVAGDQLLIDCSCHRLVDDQLNNRFLLSFWDFAWRCKSMRERNESIRTIWDISRDDRTRTARQFALMTTGAAVAVYIYWFWTKQRHVETFTRWRLMTTGVAIAVCIYRLWIKTSTRRNIHQVVPYDHWRGHCGVDCE